VYNHPSAHAVTRPELGLDHDLDVTTPCPIEGCTSDVSLNSVAFREHMQSHAFADLPNSNEKLCSVQGCVCVGSYRSCPRGTPHPCHTRDIIQHMLDQHSNLIWPCERCGKVYSTERSLRRHRASDCSDPAAYALRFCGLCRTRYAYGHSCTARHAPTTMQQGQYPLLIVFLRAPAITRLTTKTQAEVGYHTFMSLSGLVARTP
jgi:hypothetical protein